MLRVASYNIRKGVGLDWQRRPDRVVEVISEIGADVVALQEADRRLGARHRAIPHELLEQSGLRLVAPEARGVSMGWHGNALLARPGIKVRTIDLLDLPYLEPRGAVAATMENGEQAFRVVGVHLGLSRRYRRMQISHILRHLADGDAMPTIIMGDFNEWRSHALSAGDFGTGHALHLPGRTFHSSRPSASLDRIVTSGGAVVTQAGINKSDLARMASDHLPIWADVEFRPS
jgi:endonuclease/exonuclease/phosphatase family metal-dependent hydrolase